MFQATLRKEFLQVARNRWLCGALLLFVALVSVSLLKGMQAYRDLADRQRAAQLASRKDWINQDTRSAHMATHHGTSVHKVLSPLFAFDLGVDPHLGTAVRLESHHQQPMTEPLVEEMVDPLHFDVSSPALLLQFILPLLVIFLAFSGISRERELGTLPLVLSSGLTWRGWVWAKVASIVLLVGGILFVPLVWLGGWLITISPLAEIPSGELLSRFGLLSLCLLLFLGGWTFLALAVSARVRTSQAALVILLALWAGWSIVLPRLAVEFARQKAPLPLQEDLVRYSQSQVRYGEETNTTRKIYEDLEKKLLKEHGVRSTKDLPLNFGAAKMIALEKHTDALYDARVAKLNEIFIAQDQVVEQAAWGSPYLAMRSISSAIAGTDRYHHDAFYDAAEAYRRTLVRIMNEFDMAKVKPTKEKAGPEVWGLVPEFQYRFPTTPTVVQHIAIPFAVLIFWFFGTAIFALIAPANR